MDVIIQSSFYSAVLLFIFGLKRMSHPKSARGGIVWAGVGMLVATLATFFLPDIQQDKYVLIIVAVVVGSLVAWISGKKVAMTNMPQMVALYNGMGGGAAACIGAIALFEASHEAGAFEPSVAVGLGVVGSLIGSVSFSGSLIAFAKLQGWADKVYSFPGMNFFNLVLALVAVGLGVTLYLGPQFDFIIAFFVLALALGILMTLPIGGADMPVVISLYNALTGLAVAFEGYLIASKGGPSASGGIALIIAGTVVGAAGTLLTQLMAKAMNRSLANVLFVSMGSGGSGEAIEGTMKEVDAADAAVMMAFAERVIIVPGYGLAVAQAQHKIWELTERLIDRGVKVRFAIHPVAGRMPGHMNVLLAEAGVPYDLIEDMEDVNPEFEQADVALIIGANDVVNPVARTDKSSPIYGMPILDCDKAKNAIVIKRGRGTGFAGIENALFYADNCRMLYGDGSDMAYKLVQEVKQL
jgi:NAD(P) transhydrogenase subunit beta